MPLHPLNDLLECFSEPLTSSQNTLVKALHAFLESPDHQVFIITGQAGTGKTYITKGITQYLQKQSRDFLLAAPTGKAARVIASKTGVDAFTLHSAMYKIVDEGTYEEFKKKAHETQDDALLEALAEDENEADSHEADSTEKATEEAQEDEPFTLTAQSLDTTEYAILREDNHEADTVFIIDEASMVGDQAGAVGNSIRFGSGRLLDDLIQWINFKTFQKRKIIFIGDSAQLQPIRMKLSPALDPEYIRQTFGLKCQTMSLTEVMRQKHNSGILRNAQTMREQLEKRNYRYVPLDPVSHNDTHLIGHETLLPQYLADCGHGVNPQVMVVAYSNKEVNRLNREIRQALFPNQASIVPGDMLICTQNNYSTTLPITLYNGDFLKVLSVDGKETQTCRLWLKASGAQARDSARGKIVEVTLHYCNLTLVRMDEKGPSTPFQSLIIEDLLYREDGNLTPEEYQARRKLLKDHFIDKMRLQPMSAAEAQKEFFKERTQNPYFNALQVRFGYAITGHRSQGSEWETVYVSAATRYGSESYLRWLYTTSTRARQKLVWVDLPHNYQKGTAPNPLSKAPSDKPPSDHPAFISLDDDPLLKM